MIREIQRAERVAVAVDDAIEQQLLVRGIDDTLRGRARPAGGASRGAQKLTRALSAVRDPASRSPKSQRAVESVVNQPSSMLPWRSCSAAEAEP